MLPGKILYSVISSPYQLLFEADQFKRSSTGSRVEANPHNIDNIMRRNTTLVERKTDSDQTGPLEPGQPEPDPAPLFYNVTGGAYGTI